MGRDVLILSICPPFLTVVHARSTITTTATAFQKNSSFAECVLWEISDACVDTKCLTSEITYVRTYGVKREEDVCLRLRDTVC